jgi:hypothetical protein
MEPIETDVRRCPCGCGTPLPLIQGKRRLVCKTIWASIPEAVLSKLDKEGNDMETRREAARFIFSQAKRVAAAREVSKQQLEFGI